MLVNSTAFVRLHAQFSPGKMITTEHSLIARLRERAIEADWERFYRLYEKSILAIAASRSLSEADCRDVLQETMTKMFRHGFVRYDPARGRFTPFLFGIAKDCAIDALRRRGRRNSQEVLLKTDSSQTSSLATRQQVAKDPALDPAGAAELRGQQALIATALEFLLTKGTFAPKTVQMFKAVVFTQMAPSDVAKSFKTSRGNVDQAKSAVLKKLRPMYEGLDQGLDLEQAFLRVNA
jgi:RNA polymerase sigma factor (sigma-70 family)